MDSENKTGDSENKTGCSGLPGWALVAGVLGSASICFWYRNDDVAASLLFAMLVAGLSGYRLGALKLVGFFAGMSAAVAFAPRLGNQLEPIVAEWLGTSGLMNRVVSISSVGLGIILTVAILVAVLSRRLLTERPRLANGNRWLGFAVGGVQGVLIVSILIGGLLVVEPMARQRVGTRGDQESFGRSVAQQVVKFAEQTRTSKLGQLLATHNPFDHIPQLAHMQHSVCIASNPQRVKQLFRHPSMTQLKEKPELRSAIASLTSDAQIQRVLESGQPIDTQTAMSLMNNPSILQLLDDPEFMTEVSKIVGELDPDLQDALEPPK